ncbi:unnamed protein product [Pleuronectes platessa]|uniref:Uncharacterized protein n=1 Tax=Pleuronectes platessa TaxID=8262 RepID=A0A9N7TX05_PLEPL|nr:unnamed protein product [Pleuronectes platessa]
MCSSCPRSPGREKAENEIKGKQLYGGLHNSAAIPGVIVFPLRLSCRDESLMHSCLGIMDGTGQLLPSTAAGAGPAPCPPVLPVHQDWNDRLTLNISVHLEDGMFSGPPWGE